MDNMYITMYTISQRLLYVFNGKNHFMGNTDDQPMDFGVRYQPSVVDCNSHSFCMGWNFSKISIHAYITYIYILFLKHGWFKILFFFPQTAF